MSKRLRLRVAGVMAAVATAGALAAVAMLAPAGSGAAPTEKEYTASFEPECVLAPGVLNIKGKIKVSTKAMGPTTVAPGEEVTLTGATSTIVTPVAWSESFFTFGAREARGSIEAFILESSGAEPTTINAATPTEFPTGLPFKTPVEQGKELTFTAPSEGRTFKIGPLKVTGSAGETTKLSVSTEPGFEETVAGSGQYKATGKGIVSSAEGINSEGNRAIGPVSVACTAPAGVVLGEIPIVSTTTETSSTETTSETTSSTESPTTTSETSSTTESPTTTSETTSETTSSTESPTTTSETSSTTESPTTTSETTSETTSSTESPTTTSETSSTTESPTTTTSTTSPTTTTTTTTTSTTSTVAGAPEVTRIVPTSGPTFGFTPVLIEGRGLTGEGGPCFFFCKGVTVSFGATEAFVLFDSPTRALVLSPPNAPGTVDVTVTVDGRTSATSPADRFTYKGRHSWGFGW